MESTPKPGSIGWIDLTVPNAGELRDFYQAVAGWMTSEVAMGGYRDYCMHPEASSPPVAGVCHARGHNADLPAQWLIYITVADLDAAMARCRECGGRVIAGPKSMGGQARYCVIRDPAGAVAALYAPGSSET
jgi:predicted enzyme related to lactoylglutathione lyase